jgi:hypothetical protein
MDFRDVLGLTYDYLCEKWGSENREQLDELLTSPLSSNKPMAKATSPLRAHLGPGLGGQGRASKSRPKFSTAGGMQSVTVGGGHG